jgi:ATP-dependent helicase/nuclease subunit A
MIDPPSKEELQTRLEELQTRLAESTAQEIAAQDRWETERRTVLEPVEKKRVMSATAMARMVDDAALELGRGDEDDDRDDQGVVEVGEVGTPVIRRKGRAGSAIGRAVHNTLEYLDFANPGDVEQQVARQCDLELIPELSETVLALVQSALGSEAVRLAVEYKAYKEIYVAAPLGETMVEGYVDLLIETPDGLIIVDYKTDSARTKAEVDKKLAAYELQGASYAVVLEESTGMKVIDCRFVFCNTGGTIERSVVDLDAAKQRVRNLASS